MVSDIKRKCGPGVQNDENGSQPNNSETVDGTENWPPNKAKIGG
jgi:hypothetical protein